jgi:hypothetical protein
VSFLAISLVFYYIWQSDWLLSLDPYSYGSYAYLKAGATP